MVTWGKPAEGGNSSAVQGNLRGVQQIAATNGAFAAVLEDGSVVTWGSSEMGGDSSAVQHQLKTVKHVLGAYGAFAALLADGSVVTWGDVGGDCQRPRAEACEAAPGHTSSICGHPRRWVSCDMGQSICWR